MKGNFVRSYVLIEYSCHLPVLRYQAEKVQNLETKICATKVSAGVSTGIGDHEEKYDGKECGDDDAGDEQFEINDGRSFDKMYKDMENGGLQPVLNDYIYV